jgi:DNA mismatch endonuclease (patch repair protein)
MINVRATIPTASSAEVRRRMRLQKRKDTTPELRVRRVVHAAGYRYRLHIKVPGAPRRTIDMAFTRAKVAVFVDGCYWHGCPDHGHPTVRNSEWWAAKIEGNRVRDRDTDDRLSAMGWRIVRVWEHEDAQTAAARIIAAVGDAT